MAAAPSTLGGVTVNTLSPFAIAVAARIERNVTPSGARSAVTTTDGSWPSAARIRIDCGTPAVQRVPGTGLTIATLGGNAITRNVHDVAASRLPGTERSRTVPFATTSYRRPSGRRAVGVSRRVLGSSHDAVTGTHEPLAFARRPTEANAGSTGSLNVTTTEAFGSTSAASGSGTLAVIAGAVASIANERASVAVPPWLSTTRTRRVAAATSRVGAVHA